MAISTVADATRGQTGAFTAANTWKTRSRVSVSSPGQTGAVSRATGATVNSTVSAFSVHVARSSGRACGTWASSPRHLRMLLSAHGWRPVGSLLKLLAALGLMRVVDGLLWMLFGPVAKPQPWKQNLP